MKNTFKAIFFDLDGTMFDTAPELIRAINEMLKRLDFEMLPFATIRNYIGKGVDHLIQRSIESSTNQKCDLDFNQAKRAFNDIYQKISHQSKPYQYVEETLRFLKGNDMKLACVTNKPSMHTHEIIEKSGFSIFFDYVICGDEMTYRKPHPYSLELVRSKLMIKKEETLMVGDSVNDIQAANRAGIKIATVPYGYQHEESIDRLHVDYKLNTFNDLKQIIH